MRASNPLLFSAISQWNDIRTASLCEYHIRPPLSLSPIKEERIVHQLFSYHHLPLSSFIPLVYFLLSSLSSLSSSGLFLAVMCVSCACCLRRDRRIKGGRESKERKKRYIDGNKSKIRRNVCICARGPVSFERSTRTALAFFSQAFETKALWH